MLRDISSLPKNFILSSTQSLSKLRDGSPGMMDDLPKQYTLTKGEFQLTKQNPYNATSNNGLLYSEPYQSSQPT